MLFSKKNSWTLITGGAGFIGTNLAHRLLSEGKKVLIFDNLSRPGVESNLNWICRSHGNKVRVEIADVLDTKVLGKCVSHADVVYHFAAQVAVTSSLQEPEHDFDVNVRGTFGLLELLRNQMDPPPLLFTSTNKVYGNLCDMKLIRKMNRYEPSDFKIRQKGVGEDYPLDFRSPYGCSKGAADMYILDYSRIFKIPASVFRMSCIFGPHQFGTEDQGWVAHFMLQALNHQPIILYGDGMQVRDVLFVEDLVDAMRLWKDNAWSLAGHVFNIGGGTNNILSLIELIDLITELNGEKPQILFSDWRTEDQKYYVSNIFKYHTMTGWRPRVDLLQGIRLLWQWLNRFLHDTEEEKLAGGTVK